MHLLVFRHGKAELGAQEHRADEDRPLSPAGSSSFMKAARCWAGLVPALERIITSPFLRARQTGQLLSEAFGTRPPLALDAGLQPSSDPQEFLARLPNLEHIAVVSHMPFVGCLAALLLTGTDEATIALEAGQGMWFTIPGPPATTGARLLCALSIASAEKLGGVPG
ncbi:MAG: histidine phosphatase family protein [Planctomycetota bacterium]